ncbi:pim1 [Ecytonucleospora hepatopenaei]|uniref:Pim1 n=1 Tax=Ecytonucleospora hepatopenaei TaxID=646526 RepID=A0A1W0E3F7_9MICR|nr:pim1 [Ecytonucleospora hepatopenaei]
MALYGFGSNIMGQLGLEGDEVFFDTPIEIKQFRNKKIIKIACGKMHSLVLCENNELYSWGVNDDYALGREGVEDEGVMRIDFKDEISDICAGASFSAILTNKGSVFICGTFKSTNGVFGFSRDEKFGVGFHRLQIKGIKSIGAGSNHLLMIHRNGDIFSVGANESFQLGRKHRIRNEKYVLIPHPISSQKNREENYNFVKAVGGAHHSFAINVISQGFGWGSNCNGQLGTGTFLSEDLKHKLEIENIDQIECGYNHTILLTKEKKLYGCGDNAQFQLSKEGEILKGFQILTNLTFDEIKSGGDFIVVRRKNKLFCRGINVECECGQPNTKGEINDFTEVKFSFKNIVKYACGGNFTLVYTEK